MKAGFHAAAKIFAPSTQKFLIGNDFCYIRKPNTDFLQKTDAKSLCQTSRFTQKSLLGAVHAAACAKK